MKPSLSYYVVRALSAAGPIIMAELFVSAAQSAPRPEGVWMLSDTARQTIVAWRYVEIGKSRLTLDALNDGRLARRWTHDVDAIEGNYTLIPFTIVPSGTAARQIVAADIIAMMPGKWPDVTAVGLIPEEVLAGPDKPTSFMAVFPAFDLDMVGGFKFDGPASIDTLVRINSWK